DLIYLNHAAVSPWPKRTTDAVSQFAHQNMTIGASNYPQWMTVEDQLREKLKWLVNADSTDEIALLKNTSEALSVVAYGLDWKSGDNIVSCADEFPSNRIVWESLSQYGVALKLADFDDSKSPEDQLIELMDENTRLLTVSSVQYASGLVLDINKLGNYCHANDILFCVDAIQSLGVQKFDVNECHADFVMADGHKWMLGPEGIAVFYCKQSVLDRLHLNQYGWHMIEKLGDFSQQEWSVAKSARRFECGSPNMLGIHALNASLSVFTELGFDFVEAKIKENAQTMLDHVAQSSQLELPYPPNDRLATGILNFTHKRLENAELFKQLTERKIICAQRGLGIRFSPHFYTPRETIDKAFEVINSL
ncbi:MAG: aminotransferase class V-fold PLP-dependent enzyme, partial [Methylococcales bacterium]|nr:aminotransferase class V-fold PLP-dependent enzyme [Methylococcales bacterium]